MTSYSSETRQNPTESGEKARTDLCQRSEGSTVLGLRGHRVNPRRDAACLGEQLAVQAAHAKADKGRRWRSHV